MNEQRRPAPERLTSGSHAADSPEERAAGYLRSAVRASAGDVGPVALARVAARLAKGAEPLVPARLHWKTIVAVIAIAVCAGGGTGAAVWVIAPRLRARHETAAPPPTAPAPAHPAPRARHVGGAPAEEPALAAPPVLPPPPEAPPPAADDRLTHPVHRAGAARAIVAAPASAPAPAASLDAAALAQESELVGLALRRLRRDHDPRGALAALDEHDTRFAGGALGPEAEIARIEVLLALDRRKEALAILNGMAFPDSARGRELLVVRAELRAGGGCREAVADFTRALVDPALEAPLAERALHGRAACHITMGNRSAASADLDAYLRRFPDGRFAADSRRSRGDGPPNADERSRRALDTGSGGATP